MKIYKSLEEFSPPKDGCVLSVGNFDGVHLGHQVILARAREIAQENSLPLVGMTFDPAPVKLLRPDKAPRILTPLEIKIPLLAAQGLDYLVLAGSTLKLLAMSPKEFVAKILVQQLGVRHMVEGQTFNFGQHRSGTIISLQELGQKFDFEVYMVPVFCVSLDSGQVAVSSTVIRQQIATNQFEKARLCLGRDYVLAGKVVRGRGTGQQLGFPTANLELYSSEQATPEDGVFAGYARLGTSSRRAWEQKQIYLSAISIGRCETFADGQWQVEAYLLDYPDDGPGLYGKDIMVSLVEKIRLQQRFSSSQELADAIKADCKSVRQILQNKRNLLS